MTALFYILVGMFSAVMLTAAVLIVFKEGEKELITKYTYTGEDGKQ